MQTIGIVEKSHNWPMVHRSVRDARKRETDLKNQFCYDFRRAAQCGRASNVEK